MKVQFVYWKSILTRAWKKTIEKFGWFGIILDLIVAAIVTWLTNRTRSWEEIGSSEVFLAAIVFVLIFIVIYLIFIFSEFAVYDNEKNTCIRKLETEAVIAEKLTISSKEEGAWKQEQYVWLLIDNQESYDLQDSYVTLRKILVKPKKFDRWVDFERSVIENTNKLTWPSLKDRPKTVRRNNKERVNVAKLVSDKVFFTLEDGDRKVLEFTPAQIYIEVSLNGEMNGKPILEKTISGLLVIEISQGASGILGPRFYLLQSPLPE